MPSSSMVRLWITMSEEIIWRLFFTRWSTSCSRVSCASMAASSSCVRARTAASKRCFSTVRVLLGVLAIRHVELRGEVELQLAVLVGDGAEVERVPEGGAILAVVEQVDGDRRARFDGVTHERYAFLVRLRPLQETAVAAHDLVAPIAAEAKERFVAKYDRIVGQARIGDDHRHAGGANGRGKGITLAGLGMQIVRQVPRVGRLTGRLPIHHETSFVSISGPQRDRTIKVHQGAAAHCRKG